MTADDDDGSWQRLHTLTLLLAFVRLGPKSLNMIPAFAAIGIAGNWAYVVPAILAFVVFNLGFAGLAWARFRYRASDDAIIIESGIFSRQHRTIPFDRIQDVSIEQGLVARMLDLAKVGFETGGASAKKGDDGTLDSVSLADAERLRGVIRAWRSGGTIPSPAASGAAIAEPIEPAAPADRPLFSMTPRQLIHAGLFNFSLAALAVVGAAGQWLDDFLPFNIFNPTDWAELAENAGLDAWVNAHRWLAIVGGVLSLLFIGFATGVVRTILTNWNFQLSLGPRAFRRVRGLTTRTDVAIPLARVQAAIIRTGIIRRHWGWHELTVESLASESNGDKDHQLVPFGALDTIDTVLDPLPIRRPADNAAWNQGPALATAASGLLLAALAMLAAVGVAVLIDWRWGAALAAAALAFAGLALFSARFHRWHIGATQLVVRRGWWRPSEVILPFASVQSADIGTGPILRRFACVQLKFGVPGASGFSSHEIHAIPLADAFDLRQRMLAIGSQRQ